MKIEFSVQEYFEELSLMDRQYGIDGTKLEACANKYTFVWRKSVDKWEEKMFLKMEQAVALLNKEYIQSFTITKENRTKDLEKIFDYLQELCIENEVIFVHGRGKRKSIHQNTMNYSKK